MWLMFQVRELVDADAEVFKCRSELQGLKNGYLKVPDACIYVV